MDDMINRIQQMVIALTPFQFGGLQGSVRVIETIYGYQISWGDHIIVYANRVNETSKVNAGYVDRAVMLVQAMVDGALTDDNKLMMDVMSGNVPDMNLVLNNNQNEKNFLNNPADTLDSTIIPGPTKMNITKI